MPSIEYFVSSPSYSNTISERIKANNDFDRGYVN